MVQTDRFVKLVKFVKTCQNHIGREFNNICFCLKEWFRQGVLKTKAILTGPLIHFKLREGVLPSGMWLCPPKQQITIFHHCYCGFSILIQSKHWKVRILLNFNNSNLRFWERKSILSHQPKKNDYSSLYVK